jgi:hypothetical protein
MNELLLEFNAIGIRYLLIGGQAMRLAGICGIVVPCGFTNPQPSTATSNRPATARQTVWRRNHSPRGPRLRAEHELAPGKAAAEMTRRGGRKRRQSFRQNRNCMLL